MGQEDSADLFRRLPPVDLVLERQELRAPQSLYGRELVRVQIGQELEALRELLRGPAEVTAAELERRVEALPGRVAAALEAGLGKSIRRVLNATGVFLHTNLGRAPLPREVARQLPALLDAYCDLELDLETGKRGNRNRGVAGLLTALTGAESAVVVNNNAGALALVLVALARGREVIVSRGELVEIGGSFRIPDILAAAGVELVEVGTTNRTRISDYESALGEKTALLLKVHTSNYRQVGFVEAVAAKELAALGRGSGVPLVVDEGAGLLRPHSAPALASHPSFAELLRDGADLVCGSGDKLLGGPQAGLIAGRAELVERCAKAPLYRAMRPDRACLATLDAVLRIHLAGRPLPLDRLWPDPAAHRARLEPLAQELGAEIVPAEAFVGGGAAPEEAIPGEALALADDPALLARLRRGDPPVVGYIKNGRLVLDLRTVEPEDDALLKTAVTRALAGDATRERPSLSV